MCDNIVRKNEAEIRNRTGKKDCMIPQKYINDCDWIYNQRTTQENGAHPRFL